MERSCEEDCLLGRDKTSAFLEHYNKDLDDRETVIMVRMATNVAMRLLDLSDIWDSFKVWCRIFLFFDENYGHETDHWERLTRPLRWKLARADEKLSTRYRKLEGTVLHWTDDKDKER